MKYIRTKDGIYIPCELKDYENYWCKKGNLNISKLEDLEVVKQADTIEELCDEFVMLRLKDELNDNEPIIFKHLDLAKSYFEKYLGYAIYGAIWTDKGLFYVAKMNEKGDLELL